MSTTFRPELEKLNFRLVSPSIAFEEVKDTDNRVVGSIMTTGKFEKKTMKQNSAQYHYVDVTPSTSVHCMALVKVSRPMRRRNDEAITKEIPRESVLCTFNVRCKEDFEHVNALLKKIFS